MIEITFRPDTFCLDITGHAGYGKPGEDIVCAAVSTLFYTLGEALYQSCEMLDGDFIFSDENGNGQISCKPKQEYEGNIARTFWTILTGFELLEKNYKNFINLRVVG